MADRARMALMAGVVALAGATGFGQSTHAAVRLCEAVVSSGLQTAASEPEARRKAMAAWLAGAARVGPEYTSWRLAIGKHLACARQADGAFGCLAKAEPCTIKQVPPPPDVAPQRKAPGIDG